MNLNFKEFGQGDPLIILHGLFGTLDNWQTIARQLAEHYTVYIVDQRNHGRSPHDNIFDYPTLAADLQAFMVQNWIYEAHLIGHSMGGKTVMQFALDYPDMVNKLVVVDIAPIAYPERHNHIFEALLNLDLQNLKSRNDADSLLKTAIPEFGERQFLMKNLTRLKEGGFQYKMNLPVIHQNYHHVLAALDSEEIFEKETLFIKGGNSKHVLKESEEAIFKLFPSAQIENIAGAGHWVHADAPEKLLKVVSTFLED